MSTRPVAASTGSAGDPEIVTIAVIVQSTVPAATSTARLRAVGCSLLAVTTAYRSRRIEFDTTDPPGTVSVKLAPLACRRATPRA